MEAQAEDVCELQGNPDLYGLGIRVGIYSQLLTACISMILTPTKCSDSLTITLWFHFSLLVGLLYATANRELQGLEIAIVFQLLFFVAVSPIPYLCLGALRLKSGKPSGRWGCSLLTLVSCAVLQFATFSFAGWFAFVGKNTPAPTPCPSSIFYSPPGEQVKPASSLGKVQLALWMFSLAVALLSPLWLVYASLRRSHPISTHQSKIVYILDLVVVPTEEGWSAPTTTTKPVFWKRAMVWALVVVLALLSVLLPIGTEVMLQRNRVTGVYSLGSAGQLIPFTIGIGMLLVCVNNIYIAARQQWGRLKKGQRSLRAVFFGPWMQIREAGYETDGGRQGQC